MESVCDFVAIRTGSVGKKVLRKEDGRGMFRRCASAPANLAGMAHRKRVPREDSRTTIVVASVPSLSELDCDDDRDKLEKEPQTSISTIVDTESVVGPGKDASFYEIVQCFLDDECSVDTDKHTFLFLFGAAYEMTKTFDRMTDALEELLVRMLVRFLITYSMHFVVDNVHKTIVHIMSSSN